jgi:tripartite-type tricarboxylate transporter receptor subunit TctC
MMKRSILAAGLFLIAYGLSLSIPMVQAQPFPNRPIQLIIANVPGAQSDISGRLLAEEMEKILGTKIVVVNKPGASGTLGTDAVVRSKKDGYTIGYPSAGGIVYARVLNPDAVPYDPDKDLEPLGLHLFFPNIAAVQASAPWKNFGELVNYAKKNPGKVRVGTIGQGSIDSFNLEITQTLTGAQFTSVPFKGGESVLTALLGGHIEVAFDVFSKYLPHVNAGKVRILLLTKKKAELPDVPTITELGYKQELPSVWMALFAPAGIPEEAKKVLVAAIEKAAKNPELKAKIEGMGNIVDYKSPAELKKIMTEDYERALSIAKKIGLRKP